MSDLISRQAAIDLISREETLTAFADYVGSGMSMNDFDALWDIVAKMPAFNPTKTGHWIFDDECKEHGHCSRCGYGSVDLVDGESHNFCRNCGAWMIEPQERSGEV